MDSSILSAIITGFLSLIGAFIATIEGNRKFETKIEKNQAVTDCKLDEISREINKHSEWIEKMPRIEEKIENMQRSIENRRIN